MFCFARKSGWKSVGYSDLIMRVSRFPGKEGVVSGQPPGQGTQLFHHLSWSSIVDVWYKSFILEPSYSVMLSFHLSFFVVLEKASPSVNFFAEKIGLVYMCLICKIG